MPKQSVTPLAYLMDMLYIQGTQLAKMVHVDRTIISRWKNGRAELNMKSAYFEDVVEAILDINEEQGIQTLERFFSSINHSKVEERETLKKGVSAWLVSKDFKKKYVEEDNGNCLYSAAYKIYKGPSGKKDALQHILSIANSLPPGDILWGYDADSHIFYTKSKEAPMSQRQFINAAKRGDEIITMLYMNRPAEQIENMFEYWLPVFLSPKSQAYYTYDTDIPFYEYVYGIKGKYVMIGANHDNVRANLYSAVYDDPMTVTQFDHFLGQHLQKFEPLMSHMQDKDLCEDFKKDEIAEYLKKDMNQYVIVDSSPFLTYSKETIEQVIFNYELNSSEERKIMRFYKNCMASNKRFLTEKSMTRVIFSMDHIQELITTDTVDAPVFASLLGRPIRIDSKCIARDLRAFFLAVKENPNVEIAVRPFGNTSFIPNLNLWTKENTVAYFYPSDDASVRVMTNEFSSVNAFYSMVDKYWNQLPYECKQRDWVYDQVKRLVEKV